MFDAVEYEDITGGTVKLAPSVQEIGHTMEELAKSERNSFLFNEQIDYENDRGFGQT